MNGDDWGSDLVASSLAAGDYDIEAYDSAGCISEMKRVTLIDPTGKVLLFHSIINNLPFFKVVVAQPVVVNPLCPGSSTGKLQFFATGGTGSGYKYSVSITLIFIIIIIINNTCR